VAFVHYRGALSVVIYLDQNSLKTVYKRRLFFDSTDYIAKHLQIKQMEKAHALLFDCFEGPSDTKENGIMDMKLEYQTFKAEPSKKADERSSEEYLRDLELKFYQRALLANSKHFIKKKNKFSSQNANENTDCYKCGNKVAETFDWDEEKVFDDKEMTQVKVLMALADDELTVRKNHARNGESIDITMRRVNILLSMDEDPDWKTYLKLIKIDLKFVEEQRLNLLSKYNKIVFELYKCRDDLLVFKQAKLNAVTFQVQNTKLTQLKHALQEQLKEERKGLLQSLRSYDHFTSGHNRVIHARGGVLAVFSQSSESSIGVGCTIYRSNVRSTVSHNDFEHFKIGEKIQAIKAKEPTKKSDLDTMSLYDLCNHLKVYESKVQKKSESNSQNMAFISLAKHSSGNEEVNTASVSTASTNVSPASANIGANMDLLSMRADRFWKKTGKKITIQGIDMAGFDKSKVECFNCHKMGHFARECRAPRSQDRGRRDNYRQGSKVEEQTPKALMAIDEVEGRLAEFKNQEIKLCKKIRGLELQVEFKTNRIESLTNELEFLKKEKGQLDTKLTGFQTASKNLDNLLESQRSDKNKEGSSPTVESKSDDLQNRNPSVSKTEPLTSTILSKPDIKFLKATDRTTETKTAKVESAKPAVKYAELYRKPSKGVKNGRSWAKNNNTRKMRSQFRAPWVPTVNIKFPTGSTKFSTADMGKNGNAIKASTCWIWKPRQNITNKGPNSNSVSMMFKKYTFIDIQGRLNGCSRHMTGNISYLSDYEPFDRGYVSFGQGGCKNTGKGTIKTDKLEFKNVYFVKDLKDFKLTDDTNVLLRTLRHHTMYSIDLNNIVPHKDLTCLVVKASADECMLWHRRLGKQHKASCKTKLVNSMTKLVHTLHMDLFGPTSEFHYRDRKPKGTYGKDYQNGVAERRNKTLIEAARTMLADAKLPVTFWAEAVNTACYVQNRVLVNKSQNKTPYKLFNGRTPAIGFLKPFGCHVMILNTLDNLGKFEAKKDEGYSIGYSMSIKAFRVHDALLESTSSNAQDTCQADAPESSGNLNPIASTTNPLADPMEALAVENIIPTVSSPVLTACLNDSPEPSNIIGVTTNTDDTNRVEADLGNMETTITAGPTPTLRIHKDHLKKPKNIFDALQDPSWVEAMQEELLQFKIQNVWSLVDCPKEAIKLFLAYASFTGFTVYKMDVKSAFLYGTIDEEVYVMQPPGFQDPEFLARVYKVAKAIRQRGDFILVQVYVDDIIFGSSNLQLCREFEALMHEKFQMSAMGELNFFLGLQVLQKEDVIFLSQDKYVGDILKKFGYSDVRSSNTPMDKETPWGKDETRNNVDLHLYRSMIGSLMYLTASRLDIMFAVYACARHQVTPRECHLHAVKRIFRYLKGHPKLRLWYPKESLFDLVAYSDSDYGEGEGSGTPTEPHHTPSPEAQQTSPTTHSSPSLPPSSALPPVADEPTSPIKDVSQGEACPTDSGLEADQDRANIPKTSTLPSDSTPRVTSLAADKGCMQQKLDELTALCTSLQRQQSEMVSKFEAHKLEINNLKARIKLLEDKDGGVEEKYGDDAPIKGRRLDKREEAAERVSVDTEEMATVLTSIDAANSTPYTRRKGKEKMVESDTPKKKKLKEQIDVQFARELEEEMARDAQRMNEQIARDAEIARIHAEEELQIMIDGLDRNNETVAKYLQEYQQFATELPIGRRIELISDLVKYQDNYAKVLKYQTHQRKPLTRKQQREFYTSILRNQAGWKAKHFKDMTLKEIKEKFDPKVHTEGQRSHWKIIRLAGSSASYQFFVDMLKHFDREDLNQLWGLVKETLSIRPATNDKEKELWVELKRLFESDVEDYLPRYLYADREGLPSEEGSSDSDDQLQASSEKLLSDGK
nr:hypothetical protein [Tanacetum cinerariifolium]